MRQYVILIAIVGLLVWSGVYAITGSGIGGFCLGIAACLVSGMLIEIISLLGDLIKVLKEQTEQTKPKS